jgi:hypothetical protein
MALVAGLGCHDISRLIYCNGEGRQKNEIEMKIVENKKYY